MGDSGDDRSEGEAERGEAVKDQLPARVRGDFVAAHGDEVYLNSAGSTLMPEPVVRALADFHAQGLVRASGGLRRAAAERSRHYQAAQANVAGFFGAAATDVVFTMNATHALNLAALSIPLEAGDELVVGALEHVSNRLPWVRAARRAGARVRWWHPRPDGSLDVDGLEALLGERTRLVSVAHVSNVTGSIAPVRAIGRSCARHGALFVLDACQSAPHLPLDAADIGCDFLAASAHKMLGPTGAGLLYAHPGRAQRLEPAVIGTENVAPRGMGDGDGGELPGLRWATAGTPPLAPVLGWSAAVDYLRALGLDAILRHERALVGRLLERLASLPQVVVSGPRAPEARAAILSFQVQGVASEAVVRMLATRHGIVVRAMTHPGGASGNPAADPTLGWVRASVYVYNTLAEMDRLADALEEIVLEHAR